MKNKILYTESQSLLSLWLCLILAAVTMASLSAYWQDIRQLSILPVIESPGFWINATIWLLFSIIRLRTIITQQGIVVYFFPFNFYTRKIVWKDIQAITVDRYHPISEFGGWGLRWGHKSRAFTAKGSLGVKLKMKTGMSFVIGTQNGEAIEQLNLNQFLTTNES